MMAQEPYLHAIQLIQTVPCLAAPGKLIAVGEPSSRLDEVIPFLASLPNVISYNPVTRQLMLRRRPGFITLEPGRVSITQVADAAEGSQLLEALVETVNATWEHRHQLLAVQAARRAPRPLDLWSSLPRSNWGECGEASCLAFAVALIQGERTAGDCPPLRADHDWRLRIEGLLGAA